MIVSAKLEPLVLNLQTLKTDWFIDWTDNGDGSYTFEMEIAQAPPMRVYNENTQTEYAYNPSSTLNDNEYTIASGKIKIKHDTGTSPASYDIYVYLPKLNFTVTPDIERLLVLDLTLSSSGNNAQNSLCYFMEITDSTDKNNKIGLTNLSTVAETDTEQQYFKKVGFTKGILFYCADSEDLQAYLTGDVK